MQNCLSANHLFNTKKMRGTETAAPMRRAIKSIVKSEREWVREYSVEYFVYGCISGYPHDLSKREMLFAQTPSNIVCWSNIVDWCGYAFSAACINCLIKHVLTVWPLASTLNISMFNKQCLMLFGRQTFPVCTAVSSRDLQQIQTVIPIWT